MKQNQNPSDRRNFIKKTSLLALGSSSLLAFSNSSSTSFFTQDGINIVGPKEGYSPQIGTLVSMLNWMRMVILNPVKGMSVQDLDYVIDDKANSIGSHAVAFGSNGAVLPDPHLRRKEMGRLEQIGR